MYEPCQGSKILTGFFHKVLSIPSVNSNVSPKGGMDKTALGVKSRETEKLKLKCLGFTPKRDYKNFKI
jgi:hypothetical protein